MTKEEAARQYTESKMWPDWDRKDAENVGAFYKYYIENLLESYASGPRWREAETPPKEKGYYILRSEWVGGNLMIPDDRSDTYFDGSEWVNGKYWKPIEWLDETPDSGQNKEEQKKLIIEIMRGYEELGLYEEPVTQEAGKYNADFLFGYPDDSIESVGYEFANAKTEAYQKECWKELLQKAASKPVGEVSDYADFDKAVGVARDEFVIAITNEPWNNKLRTQAENLLIIFDQMRERLKPVGEVSDAVMEELNELKMANMTHEYNQAEAERFRPQYEEQICAEFAEWVEERKFKKSGTGNGKWYEYPVREDDLVYYTTEQLYQLFTIK